MEMKKITEKKQIIEKIWDHSQLLTKESLLLAFDFEV